MASPGALRVGGVSVDEYASAQRRRLEAIREATAKEQSLLRQQELEEFKARSATPNRNGLHQSPPRPTAASSGGHSPDEQQRELRQRSRQLLEKERELAAEERTVDAQESEFSGRMEVIEHKKRELLQRLARAEQHEAGLKEREQRTNRREEATRQKFNTLHEKEREQRHNQSLLAAEVAERKATLHAAQRKAEERHQEESRNLQRLHAQVREMEERLRTVEMQLTVKNRALDDAERDIAREEMKQRDLELHRIESLRRDIENRITNSSSATAAY